MISLVWINDI